MEQNGSISFGQTTFEANTAGGFRKRALRAMWSSATALSLGCGPAFAAVEATNDKASEFRREAPPLRASSSTASPPLAPGDSALEDKARVEKLATASSQRGTLQRSGVSAADAGVAMRTDGESGHSTTARQVSLDAAPETGASLDSTATRQPGADRKDYDSTPLMLAQFELPAPSQQGAPAIELPSRLTYQYGYGSESDITFRHNPDLNDRIRDHSLVLTPQINGHATYRPTDWLEATTEIILEREIPIQEEQRLVLQDGEIVIAKDREFSLLIDQLFLSFHNVIDPFRFSIGRKNYEDERHWLYDTSLDMASLEVKRGTFRAEALVGREVWQDLDVLTEQPTDRIDTFFLYTDYRGIEDVKLAAYAILRDDQDNQEGRPLTFGVRSQGMRSENFSYWGEFALMRGHDAENRDYSGLAFDFGGTYRFLGWPYNPNITLGYAFASGDRDPDDGKNHAFRQTGLQSNESKFAGVSEFKYYGEVLDPELSNLKILTAGLGFRPAPNVSLDFVYHRYRLDEVADEIRAGEVTALTNQVETLLDKDVGDAFDIVLGFRSLFGIRRLGLDLRTGWFFPGKAFLRDEGDEDDPDLRKADNGFSIVAKIWW